MYGPRCSQPRGDGSPSEGEADRWWCRALTHHPASRPHRKLSARCSACRLRLTLASGYSRCGFPPLREIPSGPADLAAAPRLSGRLGRGSTDFLLEPPERA